MAEMSDYQKTRLESLEKFKSAVNDLVETMDVCIGWMFGLLTVGTPVLIYFKPLNLEGTSGAIIAFIFCFVICCISIVWRKIAVAKI